MVLEEALEIAKEQKSKINCFTEYKNAFTFAYEDGIERDGGDSPIVVPKNGETCVNFLHALTSTNYLEGGVIRDGMLN